ncbi:MAG TPA: cadmium-translocating P-type ATPase [Firmicutes bacterium]|jgi:Cd2+/Zn2+-exporting ATPase|nr:cadmium-translocating P-type ATPase [Bacillota bacterium]
MGDRPDKHLKLSVRGLDCPACATQIESAVSKLSQVKSASVDFAGKLLMLSYSGSEQSILAQVQQAAAAVEPDVVIEKRELSDSVEADHDELPWRRLLVGSLLYAIALLLPGKGYWWLFLPGYLVLGGRTVYKAGRNITRGLLFDENTLMSLATLGAFAIGEYPEAVAVMLFYEIGELFQDMAVGRSRRSIAALLDLRPEFVNMLLPDGAVRQVNPDEVSVGATIIVKPGEKVPLDGRIIEGSSWVNTVAITGESTPRSVEPGDSVLAGYVNQSGSLTVQAMKPYSESTIARILNLVEEASARKAPTERFITRFARYYTPAVVAVAGLIAVIPPLMFGQEWQQWIYRALIFLVISCPCALVISVPLGFFGGIGGAARQGILVKGANYLEALDKLHTIAFDKTGTLTQGVFQVTSVVPVGQLTQDELLMLAANAEAQSNHPIAASIRGAVEATSLTAAVTDYQEIAGEGIICCVDGDQVAVGNRRLMTRLGIEPAQVESNGTVAHVSCNKAYQGYIIIADALKPDAAAAVGLLRNHGVRRVVMLSGDREETVAAISDELALDAYYAELLPDQKLAVLESLPAQPGGLAFVGDGINDAPVLARADVGIAMGHIGSDAAIEAADVVLMTDEPARLATAMRISRKTKRIIWQNIGLAMGVKGLVMAFGAVGIATMWAAVFADVGVALLAVLNSLRALRA